MKKIFILFLLIPNVSWTMELKEKKSSNLVDLTNKLQEKIFELQMKTWPLRKKLNELSKITGANQEWHKYYSDIHNLCNQVYFNTEKANALCFQVEQLLKESDEQIKEAERKLQNSILKAKL